MISTPAYEIGGIFLLGALFMYGTLSGLIPRSFRAGRPASIVLGVLLLGYALYRFGPDLSAGLRSVAGDPSSATSPRPTPAVVVLRPDKPAPPRTKATRQPAPQWKTTIVDDSVPQASEPAPEVVVSPPASRGGPENADAIPSAKPFVGAAESPVPTAESPDGSAYDSGVKRAIESVGHFVNFGRTRERQP